METKDELVASIKDWIKIDTDISKLQKELKEKKLTKKNLTNSLVNVMKKNELDCFDINGGSLQYKKHIVKQPLTAKTLIASLQNFYSSTPHKAEELTKYLLENREEQITETIKRKIEK